MHNAACVDGGEDGDEQEWKRRSAGFESKVDGTLMPARKGHHGRALSWRKQVVVKFLQVSVRHGSGP